jgi:hypothetical protein
MKYDRRVILAFTGNQFVSRDAPQLFFTAAVVFEMGRTTQK